MQVEETPVPGAFVITPDKVDDDHGLRYDSLRTDELEPFLGRPFEVVQINYSVVHRNTLRGIHGVITPGQARYVCCVRGAVRHIVVDLRVRSATFGAYAVNDLDAESARAVYLSEGLGHGFLALTDDTCVSHAASSLSVPGTQIEIYPLDPELALPWGLMAAPVMSDKDKNAPTLATALRWGILGDPADD